MRIHTAKATAKVQSHAPQMAQGTAMCHASVFFPQGSLQGVLSARSTLSTILGGGRARCQEGRQRANNPSEH